MAKKTCTTKSGGEKDIETKPPPIPSIRTRSPAAIISDVISISVPGDSPPGRGVGLSVTD